MLARLRHDAFVCGNDKSNGVDSVSAGQHVFYKPLVARNIDKTDPRGTQSQIGKAQIDRDPASLFFRQTIGVVSG